jgi:hypothetical protein
VCGARPGGHRGLHGRRWGRRPPAPGQLHPRTAVLERDTWGCGGTGKRGGYISSLRTLPEFCSGRRVRFIGTRCSKELPGSSPGAPTHGSRGGCRAASWRSSSRRAPEVPLWNDSSSSGTLPATQTEAGRRLRVIFSSGGSGSTPDSSTGDECSSSTTLPAAQHGGGPTAEGYRQFLVTICRPRPESVGPKQLGYPTSLAARPPSERLLSGRRPPDRSLAAPAHAYGDSAPSRAPLSD